MNRAAFVLLAAVLATGLATRPARSGISVHPVRGYLGHLVVDAVTGKSTWSRFDATSDVQTVYDALTSPANFAIAGDANEGLEWGDSVHLARSGILDEITFTLFNAAGGTIDSASLAVLVGNPATHTRLGSWTLPANFVPAGGLLDGYYATLTITGLASSSVMVGGWVIVVQEVLSCPEAPYGLGVVSFSPPSVGSSPPNMYCSTLFPSSNPAGFFTLPGYPADVGYRLRANVAAPATATSWGRVKGLYR